MIWTIGILIGGLSLIVFIIFLIGVKKGLERTIEQTKGSINDLLKRGFDGGFLIITVAYTKKFIQFRKYIKSPGKYGIELCFPNAKWSHPYCMKLRSYCLENKIEFYVEQNNPLVFLCTDFKRDVDLAHDFVKIILTEIFDFKESIRLFVRLHNATLEDVLISE